MKRYKKLTPHGTRDLLFDECRRLRRLSAQLAALFESRGYSEVVTPLLEYYDVFDSESVGMLPETLYKLTDSGGRLLVLRPDMTTPIARLAATRLKDAPLPLRLFYTQRVYRVSPFLGGKSDEITQSGIELIGASGPLADLEAVTLAAQALTVSGFDRFRLELGHAGIFKALVSGLDCADDLKEDIRGFVESKNFAALGEVLDALPRCDATGLLRELPRLFGGVEAFELVSGLRNLAGQSKGLADSALIQLQNLYESLCGRGLKDHLSFDLGMVHRNHYYTGTVFRGYIENSGEAVLSGGRYDNLLAEFGASRPATGFALNLDAVCAAGCARS
jgi:ATP phosphoribosyltransferase regulatory subunit